MDNYKGPQIDTSRVELRPLEPDHIDYVLTWVNDPEVVKNFQNFDKVFTREEELAFMMTLIESPYDQIYSIFDSRTGLYLGQGGINSISPKNFLGRLSIFIVKEQQGKGYGTEAVRAIIDKAFQELKLNKVWLMVYSSNEKAIALYKKVGFKWEATLRGEYYWQEKFHDVDRMSIFLSDYIH